MQWVGPLPDFIARFRKRFREERCNQTAASLAFTTLLGIVPLLAVALVLISNVEVFAVLSLALRNFLLANLLPEKAGKVIATYALQFSYKAEKLTAIGMSMVVITAILLMHSIERAFNRIWRVRRPRPLLRRVASYLGALVLGPVALGASIAATTYLVTASLGLVAEPRWVTELVLRLLPLALTATLFGFLYFSVPNRPVVPWHAAIGGIIAALGFALTQRVFGYYLAKATTYTLIYGAFASVPIFLIWLYLSWLVVMVGALTAAVLDEIDR